jgi:hypothetical protein
VHPEKNVQGTAQPLRGSGIRLYVASEVPLLSEPQRTAQSEKVA